MIYLTGRGILVQIYMSCDLFEVEMFIVSFSKWVYIYNSL
jgi:hypothetical protein